MLSWFIDHKSFYSVGHIFSFFLKPCLYFQTKWTYKSKHHYLDVRMGRWQGCRVHRFVNLVPLATDGISKGDVEGLSPPPAPHAVRAVLPPLSMNVIRRCQDWKNICVSTKRQFQAAQRVGDRRCDSWQREASWQLLYHINVSMTPIYPKAKAHHLLPIALLLLDPYHH